MSFCTLVGDELVMMSTEEGNCYGLDPVGRRIWEIVSEPRTVTDICAELQVDYQVGAATCEAEVLAFLKELVEHRVVHVVAN
jgi:Coenzyme PQQ synthesis protein D (PqqD)